MLPGSKRVMNFAGFLACTGMMAYALYAQYVLYLDPCPLCVFQRVAVIATGIAFLAASMHNPAAGASLVYGGAACRRSRGGIGVAGRHVWLQNLPADEVPACGPAFELHHGQLSA